MEKNSVKIESDVPLGALLKFLHLKCDSYFNQNLQELNLTASQMHLLVYLDQCESAGRQVNQRDIEKHLHLSNPTVTGLLQRMEGKGFVVRTVSEIDGRNKVIQQTDLSRAIHEKMHQRLDLQNRQMVKGMTEEEVAQLRSLLTRVLQNMQD
jgi:MarR family multiple gene transcriptional regulator MgrA